MPLRGKIVVIKRGGGDGTEFPLTATCLFGRKPDCDIRIQLPHVSKEHCRIDLNENQEVILTNLSSVNPTQVNGEVLQQSERLKHGDVITVIDRSFRFEYPPAPTPKKRSSRGGRLDTLKVLQDQQVGDEGEKRVSEVSTDPLKDGTNNNNNIQQSLEKTVLEPQDGGGGSRQSKSSPFSDLYQMIKQSLDVKTPRKSSVSVLQTPSSKFCTPKPVSVRKSDVKAAASCSKMADATVESSGTPQAAKKKRKSSLAPPTEPAGDEAASPRRRSSEVVEQITQTPKSPARRRSKETTPTKEQAKQLQTASPRNSAKGKEGSKKRKSGDLGPESAAQQMKRKRVSFGGQLSPELFDKRMPPDSPLRKGATPRRSLSLLRPKQSLLRRASVIGMRKEFQSSGKTKKSTASPKTPTPEKKGQKSKSPKSPKAATPVKRSPKSASSSPKAATPAKKSPKSASSSPKAATPAKRSPRSASLSPKAATPATKSPKAATPVKRSPKSASSSPKAATPAKKSPKSASSSSSPRAATPGSLPPAGRTPRDSGTPAVQGRFSVSRIATPSPVAKADAVTEEVSSVCATPKLRLKRKSMKSTSKKTPGISKSAVKVMQRRSGISRASLKVSNCWADIVKFGKPKPQVVAQSQVKIIQKTVKKTASKPQQKTPARKPKGHVSTGHADSPATIVVGRAHKRAANRPTGAAPRVITNIALFKKSMRMDEDLSGISEMFKTPVSKKRSDGVATPAGPTVIEPSLLNTPEEPGEMVVSPLSVASTIKGRRYNSEAVQRLLSGGEESSFVSDTPALQIESQAAAVKTPKQKAEVPECLSAVKRILKTPRQKAEPVEDLRGKILKTPKQKPEEVECLSAVKRVFKTPQQEVKLLQSLKTPEAPQTAVVLETPATIQESQDLSEVTETPNTKISSSCSSSTSSSSSSERLAEIRVEKTPRVKSAPVEDLVGVKRIMGTPRVKGQPVEDDFGIKRLMRSPRLRGNGPVEDFQGLKELMEEPMEEQMEEELPEAHEQQQTNQGDQEPVQCGADVVEELEFTPRDDEPAVNVSKLDATKADEDVDLQSAPDVLEPSEVEEIVPEAAAAAAAAADENLILQQAVDKVNQEVEATPGKSEELEATVPDPEQENKTVAPVRGRRGRKAEAAAPPAVRQTKRGRNAKSASVEVVVEETPEPAEVAVKPKRGRNTRKVPHQEEVVPHQEEVVPHQEEVVPHQEEVVPHQEEVVPDQEEVVPDQEEVVPDQEEVVPAAESEQVKPDDDAPPEKLAVKPKRGRRAKQPEGAEPKQQDDSPPELTEDVGDESQTQSEVNKEADAEEAQSSAAGKKKSVRGRRGKQTEAEEKQEAEEEPVRGRRGRKAEAAAPPAVRQTKRGRNAKSASVEVVVEETPEPAEVAVKPKRGRNTRKVPDQEEVVPHQEEVVPAAESEQVKPAEAELAADDDAPPEKLAAKPKRGRRAKQPEGAEPKQQDDSPPELTEEAALNTDVSEKLESQAEEAQSSAAGKKKSVRGRRGKQTEAEEKQEAAEEPVRGRRGRKAEAAAPPAVRQTKRGRNTKTQESSSDQPADETQPESEKSELQAEVPSVEMVISEAAAAVKPRRGARAKPEPPSVSVQAQEEKPKRGRRGRQAAEEQEAASENPQNQTAAEESGNKEPDAAVVKPSKTRGAKAPAKSEAPQVAPQVAPAKRARRGAAAPPLEETEESSAAKEAKTSKTVKWNSDLEVIDVPKTAARAGRSRRSKVDSGSQNVPEEAEGTEEEEELSAPPVKRTRRGAKAADVSADKEVPAETLPRPRRGRLAKK